MVFHLKVLLCDVTFYLLQDLSIGALVKFDTVIRMLEIGSDIDSGGMIKHQSE